MKKFLLLIVVSLFFCLGCSIMDNTKIYTNIDRLNSIPADVQKGTPDNDEFAPILHSDDFIKPIPLEIISTSGAEDSPFIPDGRDELYFFFAKDVREDLHIQAEDIVNGIWMSKWDGQRWIDPELVVLQKEGKLALNGAQFIGGDEMTFVTAREGYTGLHWFKAKYIDGKWKKWKRADFNPEYEVGELHIHEDKLYYHSSKAGGKGENDIWMLTKVDGEWTNPENVEAVNTEYNEGMPYITPDGKELWFNRQYKGTPGVYRSKKIEDQWIKAELIVSQFAGEPTLDKFGNLYFVHHYFKDGQMIEADIYIAYKK
ncbi:MAG: hypothetical protein HOK80_10795 [Candidatus Cloacimonetes bacterium]|jgi:hypothetical protein|nr:hypothetical protein [Candidatus Cloacimonadota bacterium]